MLLIRAEVLQGQMDVVVNAFFVLSRRGLSYNVFFLLCVVALHKQVSTLLCFSEFVDVSGDNSAA